MYRFAIVPSYYQFGGGSSIDLAEFTGEGTLILAGGGKSRVYWKKRTRTRGFRLASVLLPGLAQIAASNRSPRRAPIAATSSRHRPCRIHPPRSAWHFRN